MGKLRFGMLAAAAACCLGAFADAALTIGSISTSPNSSKIYADANGHVSGKTSAIELTNSGDVDLTPGSDNFSLTLIGSNLDLQTIAIDQPIPAGQTVTVDFAWDFDANPFIEKECKNSNKSWSKWEFRENVTSTKKMDSWKDFYTYSCDFYLCTESSGSEISDVIDFGFVSGQTKKDLRLRSTGGGDAVITSIDVPEGFSVSLQAPITLKGLATATEEYTPIALTFEPTAPGVRSGNLVFHAEGGLTKTYAVSAVYKGPDSFFEDFETVGANSQLPEGWVFTNSKFQTRYVYTTSENRYALSHTSSMDTDSAFAITPKLHLEQGEGMIFDASKRSYSSVVEVYYSADRSNWQFVKRIQNNASDLPGHEQFSGTNDKFKTYHIDGIPEGDWYIGFKMLYSNIDNVFGGVFATVDHDLIINSFDLPNKGTVNNLYTATVAVKNLTKNVTEAAGSYTVQLLAADKVVASAENDKDMAPGQVVDFSLAYTPHDAAATDMQIVITIADKTWCTPVVTATISEEKSEGELAIGTQATNNSNVPLALNWNNSESQSIFTAELLEQYGLKPGDAIAGLALVGASSATKVIPNTFTVYMMPIEASSLDNASPVDLSDVTPVYAKPGTLDMNVSSGSSDYVDFITADFDEPYVYQGGNLFIDFRSEAGDYGSVNFKVFAASNSCITKRDDSHDKFLSMSWSSQSYLPFLKLKIKKEAISYSGTLKDAAGNAIAGQEVILTSGDITYSGTTDEQGAFSIAVFQPEHDYAVTVDNENHPVFADSVSFVSGSVVAPIVLPNFPAERAYTLSIKAVSPIGADLAGQAFTLTNNNFSIEYPATETVLGQGGECTILLYGGSHTLKLAVPSMDPVNLTFAVNKDIELAIDLAEAITKPYGVAYAIDHDIFSGKNDVTISWNSEEAVFADDFEDYQPFSVAFGDWSGIDADLKAPAIIQGSYANAGKPNYAQIINPLAVEPVWDLAMYPTLTPRSGQQYAGFVQLADGSSVNDWLITPAIEVGQDNILRFFFKSADVASAKMAVGITEAEYPEVSDFTIISSGNYLTAGYDQWRKVEISLADYAGKSVKIGFHCLSDNGTMITMLDDVFVGRTAVAAKAKAKRIARSAANPNEKFIVLLDGTQVAETEDYSVVLPDVAPGSHTVSVQAKYINSESEPVEVHFAINADDYVAADFAVTTNNGFMPEEMTVTLTADSEGAEEYAIPVTAGAATVASLPVGNYTVALNQAAYLPYEAKAEISKDNAHVAIALVEHIIAPFGISIDSEASETEDDTYAVTVKWNQDLGFADSFEDYDDFSTGEFGGWRTLDFNSEPSYPISLSGNIVNFPGASTTSAPKPVAPLVFNPSATTPSMEIDGAVAAPDGVKSVLFISAQGAVSDKWLISPQMRIGDDYEWTMLLKAYSFYPEKFELCISTTGGGTTDFEILDVVAPSSEGWVKYAIDLAEYKDKDVYLALHYIGYDCFMAQVDDVRVGRKGGASAADAGRVQSFAIALDGAQEETTTQAEKTYPKVMSGDHSVAITSTYASGKSEATVYTFTLDAHTGTADITSQPVTVAAGTGVIEVSAQDTTVDVYSMQGVKVASTHVQGKATIALPAGAYVVATPAATLKVAVK